MTDTAPVNVTPPTIEGDFLVGSELTINAGEWLGLEEDAGRSSRRRRKKTYTLAYADGRVRNFGTPEALRQEVKRLNAEKAKPKPISAEDGLEDAPEPVQAAAERTGANSVRAELERQLARQAAERRRIAYELERRDRIEHDNRRFLLSTVRVIH